MRKISAVACSRRLRAISLILTGLFLLVATPGYLAAGGMSQAGNQSESGIQPLGQTRTAAQRPVVEDPANLSGLRLEKDPRNLAPCASSEWKLLMPASDPTVKLLAEGSIFAAGDSRSNLPDGLLVRVGMKQMDRTGRHYVLCVRSVPLTEGMKERGAIETKIDFSWSRIQRFRHVPGVRLEPPKPETSEEVPTISTVSFISPPAGHARIPFAVCRRHRAWFHTPVGRSPNHASRYSPWFPVPLSQARNQLAMGPHPSRTPHSLYH